MVRFIVAACLTLTALAPASALAATETACAAPLGEADDARVALDGLQTVVDGARAERDTLEGQAAALRAQLASGVGDPATLHASLRLALTQLAELAELLPPIERQLAALLADVDAADRAYIACIDASLDPEV